MTDTAKLFMNGRSQAVRLPRDYRFDCAEVYIRRDVETGDVIISEKPATWDTFFKIRAENASDDDLVLDRDLSPPQEREPLV